jgi:hypothetical protein
MDKLKYFPFGDQFELRMGTSAFREEDRLVETDGHYASEIALKRSLLEQDHRYYYRSGPNTELAQWDVLEKVLTDLARFEPDQFSLDRNGEQWSWRNEKTGETTTFIRGRAASLPFEPLDWVGRQVQEDLIILGNDPAVTLLAGQLCFANGWSLDDKFGQPFLTIHAPAPRMIDPTMQAAQKLMERIGQRPVWRASWNFKISGQKDLSSRHTADYVRELARLGPELTPENIGQHVYIRIERQTISRLSRSNAVLFGIHLYQNTLDDEELTSEQAQHMLNVLRTTPREMINYKAIAPFESALLAYLENRI